MCKYKALLDEPYVTAIHRKIFPVPGADKKEKRAFFHISLKQVSGNRKNDVACLVFPRQIFPEGTDMLTLAGTDIWKICWQYKGSEMVAERRKNDGRWNVTYTGPQDWNSPILRALLFAWPSIAPLRHIEMRLREVNDASEADIRQWMEELRNKTALGAAIPHRDLPKKARERLNRMSFPYYCQAFEVSQA